MSPKDKQQQRERREQRQPRRALRLPEVMRKVGLRKSQLFDSIRRGVFPKPFNILPNGRAVAWDESEIDAYLEQRMAERDLKVA
jgi:prophage regulatory protein